MKDAANAFFLIIKLLTFNLNKSLLFVPDNAFWQEILSTLTNGWDFDF